MPHIPGDSYLGQERYENLKLQGEGSTDAKPITQAEKKHNSSFSPRPDWLQSSPSLLSIICPVFFVWRVERPECKSYHISLVLR